MTSGVYIRTEKTKQNMSKAQKIAQNRTDVKQKISKSLIGKKRSQEIKQKISNTKKGKKLSEEHKQNISKACKGKKRSENAIINISIAAKNKPKSKEHKLKMRQKAVERVLLNNGKFPSYNKKAIEFFKNFDKKNNTNGQYATNPCEFYIKELGYWLDYINFDLKLIQEWDESHHFEKSTGLLKQKDVIRQQEIQEKFPDFKFVRIKYDKLVEVK